MNDGLKVAVLGMVWILVLRGQNESTPVLAIQQLIERGELEPAFELAEQTLRQHPDNAGVLNLRGILHARREELPAAKKDFSVAVRLSPGLTPAWQNLGRACQQLNDDACAVEAWRRVLRVKPADPEAHGSLAVLYEKQGKFAESLAELDAGKVDDLGLRCLDLNGLGRTREAARVSARLGRRDDFSEADFLALSGSLDSAKAAGSVAVLVEAMDARGVAGIASLQKLAVAYERLQRMADARTTLERVAKLEPGNTAHLLELARVAESSRDYEGALSYLAHARDLEPGRAQIHFLFGLVAGELNLPIEAKQSLDKALAMEPDNPNFNYAMGSVILKTRDAATAAAYFQKYLNAKPQDLRGHYALGLAQFASGDYDKAKEQMMLARSDAGISGAAEYYLGRIARLEGDIEEARVRLRRAIALIPRFAETHTELARMAMAEGNIEAARQELATALKLTPESFQANQQLLVVYQRTHDGRAERQAEVLKKLDEERSRQADLMLRTIEVRP